MTIAIIAGKGDLPKMLIKKCQEIGRQFLVILIAGELSNQEFLQFPHKIIEIGHISEVIKILRENNINELVFAGGIAKPSMANLKVDAKGAILMSKILGNKLFGDDNLLTTINNFFQKEGFKIIGAEEIIDDLLAKKGILGEIKPAEEFLQDIEIGKNALKIISDLDIGQAVVVQQKQIIGVEAIEGTDALIARCGALKFKTGRTPILIKMKKVGQNNKIDLPSLGVATIENLARNNFAGIVIEAGSTLIINQKEVIKSANQSRLFILSIDH